MHRTVPKYLLVCSALLFAPTVGQEGGVVPERKVSPEKTIVWGPGLKSDFFVPVRYFFIQAVDQTGEKFTDSVGEHAFKVSIYRQGHERARVWTQVLDRHDGSYIVRFKPFETISNVYVDVLHKGKHVGGSPYSLKGQLYHEKCNCPHPNINQWYIQLECPESFMQITEDLAIFKNIDMKKVAKEAVSRFSDAGRHSVCHYKVIDNKIYRKTYGQHVGFKMFVDAILLSITKKVKLPDFEFMVNLGDWPLETRKKDENPLPIFSWCGSEDTHDIIMPTYDLTEAALEMMGRISLDIFSVQVNTGPKWKNKTDIAFWRGRDSRKERLELVMMSRKYPKIIDAALTNMFFFPKDEEKYGEIVKHISFFDFFKHKYQINLDGTVAAYRLPYLLAGDSVVLKQESPFYEHFYKSLRPYEHYIPFKRDLSDLMKKIEWAKENDEKAQQIAKNAQHFVREQLTPVSVLCYHVKLFHEYSKLLKSKTKVKEGFELVESTEDHDSHCDCKPYKEVSKRDEL